MPPSTPHMEAPANTYGTSWALPCHPPPPKACRTAAQPLECFPPLCATLKNQKCCFFVSESYKTGPGGAARRGALPRRGGVAVLGRVKGVQGARYKQTAPKIRFKEGERA